MPYVTFKLIASEAVQKRERNKESVILFGMERGRLSPEREYVCERATGRERWTQVEIERKRERESERGREGKQTSVSFTVFGRK